MKTDICSQADENSFLSVYAKADYQKAQTVSK